MGYVVLIIAYFEVLWPIIMGYLAASIILANESLPYTNSKPTLNPKPTLYQPESYLLPTLNLPYTNPKPTSYQVFKAPLTGNRYFPRGPY